MNCHYHPGRASVAHCVRCGNPLCIRCVGSREDQPLCRDCLKSQDIKRQTIILSAGICGGVVGFLLTFQLEFFAVCVLEVSLAGAVAVLLVKYLADAKKRIPMRKAALIGGMTGCIASTTMWAVLWTRVTGMWPELMELIRQSETVTENTFVLVLLFFVIFTIILFVIAGALGGVVSNEMSRIAAESN